MDKCIHLFQGCALSWSGLEPISPMSWSWSSIIIYSSKTCKGWNIEDNSSHFCIKEEKQFPKDNTTPREPPSIVWMALVMLFKWKGTLYGDQNVPGVYSAYCCQIASRAYSDIIPSNVYSQSEKPSLLWWTCCGYTKTEPKLCNDYFSIIGPSQHLECNHSTLFKKKNIVPPF